MLIISQIKNFFKKIGLNFIVFIGRKGLRLRIQDVSAKIIVSNLSEASIWHSFYSEKEILQKFLKRIDNETVFYDIGSHIGFYTLIAAGYKNTPNFIYCWEPDPSNLSRLKENIELNQFKEIIPFQVALGSKNHVADLSIESKISGYSSPSLARKGSKSISVQVVRGDDLVSEKKIYLPSIMKIDVEGYEFEVIKGLEETIRKAKPIIFLEIHPTLLRNLGRVKDDVINLLEEMNYKTVHSSIRGKQEHHILEFNEK